MFRPPRTHQPDVHVAVGESAATSGRRVDAPGDVAPETATEPRRPSPAGTGRDRRSRSAGLEALLPAWLLALTPTSSTLLAGGLVLGLLLAGALALVTLRSREDGADDDQADRTEGDSPAHPDAWRVRRLLDEHGGRLPQSEIVERTGWSKSKVSRVLSAMADDDQVRKIRIGRENLVTRPGDEPKHAGGPFEDGSND